MNWSTGMDVRISFAKQLRPFERKALKKGAALRHNKDQRWSFEMTRAIH